MALRGHISCYKIFISSNYNFYFHNVVFYFHNLFSAFFYFHSLFLLPKPFCLLPKSIFTSTTFFLVLQPFYFLLSQPFFHFQLFIYFQKLFFYFFFTSNFSRHGRECAKVQMPAHQVLLLMGYIFEGTYCTSITFVIKILSMSQSELRNIIAGIGALTHSRSEFIFKG